MNHCTKEQLIAFEQRVKALFEAGELPYLIHLSGGNESQLITLFGDYLAGGVEPGDWILSSHRNHYHYLLAGGDPERLIQLIKDGKSMFVFDKSINFLTSSILGGTACIAAGIAWQLKEEASPNKVWCFLGDGAEDNGHVYEAIGFVHGHHLPCTFVIEDNDRSVDTNKSERRGYAYENHPWPTSTGRVIRYPYNPTFPHGGAGCTHRVEFKQEAIDRFLSKNK